MSKNFPKNQCWSQKKVLSLVLCVAVMLSVMVLGAGAAFSDQDQIENTEAVDACSALNIIGGYEDGSFHPERNIKRSEITKMICVALNGGKDPNVSTNAVPTFTDVRGTSAEWAEGYIEACVAQGIVSGVGGGRFAPDGNVTAAQLAKMLLVSLGYNSDNEGFTGDAWETNVNVRASQKHLYDGLETMDTSVAVTRDQAAQMVWNAMQAYEVEYKTNLVTDENGNLSTQVVVQDKVVNSNNDKITLLRDKYDAWVYVGTLVQVDGGTLTINMSAADQAASDPVAGNNVATFTKVSIDYSDLMGQKVKVMFKDGKTNEVIGVYATSDNTVVTANQKDISVDAGKLSINDTKYTLESNGVAVYEDGELQDTNYKAGDFEIARSADVVTFIDSDGNGKIDTACIETYTVAKVTYVSDTQIIAGGKTYKADEDNIASGLAKDDWVIITANLFNQNKDVVKADMASGSVTATRAKTTDGVNWTQYQIDGTWYNETSSNNKDINANVRAGVQADYVAVNGILFYAQKTAGADATLTNVLFVSYVGTNGLNDDQAKVMFPNGDTATITLAEKSFDANWNGDFSDGGAGQVINNANAAGHFFEYTKSGNNYKLIALRPEAQFSGYYGDYTNLFNNPDLTVTASNGKVDKIGGLSIDDDADVILYTSDSTVDFVSDVKHVTGKQLKNLGLTAAAGDDGVKATALGAFSSKVNGLTRATVIAVEIDTDDGSLAGIDVSGSYAHYGYVLDDAVQVDDYTIQFPMWNGEEELTVRVAETNEANYTAGRAVGYASMTSSEVSAKAGETVYTLVDADPLGIAADTYAVDSILEVGTKNSDKLVLENAGEIDLSDYTTVLYVNSAAEQGLTNATATVADYVTVNGAKHYAKNILIVGDLVVIDTIELATGVYEDVDLPTSVAGLASVQYVNNHTQKTDASAHVDSYLTVTVQAPTSGTLTLTEGLFVDSGVNTRILNVGENKFEIVITAQTTGFAMTFGGNGTTDSDISGDFASAQDLVNALNEGNVTITGTYPTGRTVTVPNDTTLTLDMVDVNDDVTINTTGTGKVVLTNAAFIKDTKTLTVNGTLEVAEDYTGNNVAGTIAADVVDYPYEVENDDVTTLLAMASSTGAVTVGDVTNALNVSAGTKTLNIGTAMDAITVTTGTVNAEALTAGKAVSVAASQKLTVASDTTLANTDTIAGTLEVAGKLTTTGACAFTGDVKAETIEIGTSYQVATGKTLTLTAATPAADLEKVTGQAATAKFIHAGSSDTTENITTGTSKTAKFYSAEGTLNGSANSEAATVAESSGVIDAGTYVWNTDDINSNSDDITNNTTAYAAWLAG